MDQLMNKKQKAKLQAKLIPRQMKGSLLEGLSFCGN